MIIQETRLTDDVLKQLIDLSIEWENEDSCHGYRHNQKQDIEGNRIFIVEEDDQIIGYLFGHEAIQEERSSVIEEGKKCFEVLEIYVKKDYRDQGIGRQLFRYVEEKLPDTDYLTLSTATKNYKAILHFYIDEAGMSFHNARLFKKLR